MQTIKQNVDIKAMIRYGLAFDINENKVASGANAAVTLTLGPDPDVPIILAQLHFGFQGTGTVAGTIQITDSVAGVIYGPFAVTQMFTALTFDPCRVSGRNASLAILLGAGGSGLTGIIWANAYKLT